jgi:hypothetical protein
MTDTTPGECVVCLAEDPPVHTAATAMKDGNPVCAAHAAGEPVEPVTLDESGLDGPHTLG